MISIGDNLKLLNAIYATGYTEFRSYCRTFDGISQHDVDDVINDTYILLHKTICNSGATTGVSHKYIIRSLKLNYFDKKRRKNEYNNWHRKSDDELKYNMIYDIHDEMDMIQKRVEDELKYKVLINYVDINFNTIESSLFKMRYISGLNNKQIKTILESNKYKYSESKISLIFKRIMTHLTDKFGQL